MSIFDVQMGMRTVLESLLRNKHIDLIIFCTVVTGLHGHADHVCHLRLEGKKRKEQIPSLGSGAGKMPLQPLDNLG